MVYYDYKQFCSYRTDFPNPYEFVRFVLQLYILLIIWQTRFKKEEITVKITEVNTYTVRPRWGFVEIMTDEGITGWGEPVLEGHCESPNCIVIQFEDSFLC